MSKGYFAKLCHVRKQTLFYYDEIGLLTPELKKENGYRFYSYSQFELFQVIKLLKMIGIPLLEIKSYLEGRRTPYVLKLLDGKADEIDKEINRLSKLKELVNNKIGLYTKALQTNFSSISLEKFEEEIFLVSEDILDFPEKDYISSLSNFINHIQSVNFYSGYPVGAIFKREQILDEDFYNYSYWYIKVKDKKSTTLSYHIKPKGLYVVGYQKGEEVEDTYEKMLNFIIQNKLKLGDYSYEEYVIDELATSDSNNQITKIQIKVYHE